MTRSKFKILLVYPNLPMMLVTPLSIAAFIWILRREGFEVDLFDTTSYGEGDLSSPQNRVKYLQARNLFSEGNLKQLKSTDMVDDFQRKLESFSPDLILYSFPEDGFRRAIHLLRVSNPYNIPTIVGGILATSAPDWLISHPEVAMLGVEEGEELIKEVALRLAKGKDIFDVAGLWIKKKDGSIIRNAIGPYVDLDDYSTDFSLFDEERLIRPMGGIIHRALPIETYRGCPHDCTFCNSSLHNRIARERHTTFLRRRSIDGIRKEIKHLLDDYAINLLYVIDDSFLARPKHEIDGFMEMYKEFKIPFWCNTRPEHCTLETLTRMKDVGLFRMSFGIESGNEDFRRKNLNRNITNEKLLHCFDIIDQSGVAYSINCMIGFPFETREMVFDTIRLAKKIKGYDSLTVSIFTPYRGTILRQKAIEAGWLDPEAQTIHTTATSLLNMPHFTARQIDGLMRTFPLYVEFDEFDWPEIEKAELSEPGGEEILVRYSELYKKRRWEKNPETKRRA
ncbi:B12-binding domain-containing radical SAM protein [Candidatus Saganbacteria bacterium]|nr:B12-binding domain-containing radical SAM protein [Candidatus Saganbacteria bacterium]